MRQQRAFTLIELLAVITIIALLAGLVTPAVISLLRGSKVQADATIMDNLKLALERYAADKSTLGNEADGAEAAAYFPFMYGWYLNGARLAEGKSSFFQMNNKLALVDPTPLYDFTAEGLPDFSSKLDTVNGPVFETPAVMNYATHIANPWGFAYTMRVRNVPIATGSSRYRSTHLVVRSFGEVIGDGADLDDSQTVGREDDVFWLLDLDKGVWTRLWADPRSPATTPTDWVDVNASQYQGWFWSKADGYDGEEEFFLLTSPYEEIKDQL